MLLIKGFYSFLLTLKYVYLMFINELISNSESIVLTLFLHVQFKIIKINFATKIALPFFIGINTELLKHDIFLFLKIDFFFKDFKLTHKKGKKKVFFILKNLTFILNIAFNGMGTRILIKYFSLKSHIDKIFSFTNVSDFC